jgi:hypothetical protein
MSELLPELESMLRHIDDTRPAAATRAGRVLARLCRPWLERSPLPRSVLTPGGYPIELTFRSDSSDVTYTAEPGMPDATPGEKWRFVRELERMRPAGAALCELIAEPNQRFGCWLGIRPHASGTSFKVYQEVVPRARARMLEQLRRDVADVTDVTSLTPTLVGVTDGEISEYYCQVGRPNTSVLYPHFAAAGVGKQLPPLLDYVAWLAGAELGTLWNRLHFGVSYKFARGARPALTLFLHGCELFSGNRQARDRILGLARQFGRAMPAYERATRAFEAGEREMAHGMVGLRVNDSGGLECSVGLRPFL